MAKAALSAARRWLTAAHALHVLEYHLRRDIFCLLLYFLVNTEWSLITCLHCQAEKLITRAHGEDPSAPALPSPRHNEVAQSIAKCAVPPSINTHLDAQSWAIRDCASHSALRWTISPPLMAPWWLQILQRAHNQNTSLALVLINTNT